MVSVIISSRFAKQLQDLSKNVQETIGVPYELLYRDNSDGSQSLSSVYNELAACAKYNILIFLHEDVYFFSQNWGKSIIDINNDTSIGLIGLIGSNTITKVPSGWAKQDRRFNCGHILQRGDKDISEYHNTTKDETTCQDVIVIDGVFMATRKSIWEDIRFAENELPGFHGYDFDFSMQVIQKYRVVVTDSILIEHFSKGNFSKEWIEVTVKLNKKWSIFLPKTLDQNINEKDWSNLEYWQAVFMIDTIKNYRLPLFYKLYVIKQFLNGRINTYKAGSPLLIRFPQLNTEVIQKV